MRPWPGRGPRLVLSNTHLESGGNWKVVNRSRIVIIVDYTYWLVQKLLLNNQGHCFRVFFNPGAFHIYIRQIKVSICLRI